MGTAPLGRSVMPSVSSGTSSWSAADLEALQHDGHGDHRLEHREVRSDAGARAAAEREVGVRMPRALALRGKARGLERLGVVPELRMPVRRELAHDDV